ncbi:reverse transcriptase domain-containing protein [Tanacetum coccineum]
MVKALLLDKKSQAPTLVKAVEKSCVTCGGTHSYRNCPATNGNVYRDNIQEYVSQAAAANYNQGNTGYRAPIANQIRPPGFPPVQNNQGTNQNCYKQRNIFNQNRGNNYNQNRGNNYNQGQIYQPLVNQPPAYQAPPYQAPAPQTQGVTKTDFESYVKANDAVMRNMQDQNQNLQNQMTNLTDMLSKFVNANTASSSGMGSLSSNTVTNPKEDLKGITTRSGVAYQGPTIPATSSPKVVEHETEVTKDTVPPTNNRSTKDIQPSVVQVQPHSELVVTPVSAPMPNLKPTIPYPSRRNDKRRSLIGNKEKLSEMAKTSLNEHCSAVILNKLPKKLGDPDKFLIPCDFPRMDECLALADLGASINLMPLSVWKRLSLPELTPTFVDFDADPRVPLILGRSFLKTRRALIDVYEGELTLRVGKEGQFELKGLPLISNTQSLIDEPLEVELKDLPPHLEYTFLKGDDKLPVIIAKDLSMDEKAALIKVLKSRKIEVDKAKVDVIAKLPHPTTVKGVRSFLGHAGFYRRFIKDFSKISRPMTHLLEKNTPFIFSDDCIQAFQTLKKKLTEAPILIAPDWDLPFELMFDAIDFAIGAVLGQRHEKHFKPIHYASKTMTEAESRYTTTEKEMLAVVYAFEKFRSYLILNKSIVYTDHSVLKYLFAKKDSKASDSRDLTP